MFRRSSIERIRTALVCLLLVAGIWPLSAQTAISPEPRIAILFEASESASPALVAKASAQFQDHLTITPIAITAGSNELPSGSNLNAYDLVIADLSGDMKNLSSQLEDAKHHTKVLVIGAGAVQSGVSLSHPDWPQQYWANLSVENVVNLIRMVESDVLHIRDQTAKAPVRYPDQAFYHPAAPAFFDTLSAYLDWYESPLQKSHGYAPNRCTIGVLFYFSYYMQQSLAPFDSVMSEIEARGCNAVGLMTKGAPELDALRLSDGKPFVDVLLYNGERINLRNFDAGTKEADSLGVPVLGLYLDYHQSR